jgi:2-octaprenyl-6-methoxyphenol hydroxylase
MRDGLEADVVIAGGGMVGLTLALALAEGGLSVVIVDALTAAQMTDERFDGRVSAINFSAARMMRVLGVWPALAAHAQPINDILVSDAPFGRPAAPFSLHFDHREIGEPLGNLIENRHIRRTLFDAVRGNLRITLIENASVESLAMQTRGVIATLADGRTISARLAIAADGRGSRLREAQNIRVVAWEYDQTGIVATVDHARPHNGVAYEHFLPAGPFAILPMQGNRSSLVWVEAPADAARLLALPEAEFTAQIAARFGGHLGEIRASGPRWSYPLRLHLARDYVRPRFALIGDAAHGIHPLAGQGLNLGLKDVAALSETILDAARLGRDIGELDVLRRYERWRRFDNVTLAWATDTLNKLFSNDFTPLRLVRDVAMGAVDSVRPLSRFFMRHAGGDIGKLPRLMKGEAA